MVTRLILIRHGASRHKVDGIMGGPRGCRGLTDTGRAQGEALTRRLASELLEPPQAVYSSVIPRAIETASILTAMAGWPDVIQHCGLCTWHAPSDADGRPWADYFREHGIEGGGVYRPFQRGNESWSELVGRTGRALEEIAGRHRGQTVVIVTHAEVVTSSLIVFGGLPLALGFDAQVAPVSLTEWTTEGDPEAWPRPRWTLARFNDSVHLAAVADRQ